MDLKLLIRLRLSLIHSNKHNSDRNFQTDLILSAHIVYQDTVHFFYTAIIVMTLENSF